MTGQNSDVRRLILTKPQCGWPETIQPTSPGVGDLFVQGEVGPPAGVSNDDFQHLKVCVVNIDEQPGESVNETYIEDNGTEADHVDLINQEWHHTINSVSCSSTGVPYQLGVLVVWQVPNEEQPRKEIVVCEEENPITVQC